MFVAALVMKVLGEGLAGFCPSVRFVALVHEVLVTLLGQAWEVVSVQEAKGTGLLGQKVCELRARVDINAFHGVQDDEAELPVEHVHVPDAFERGSFPELI